MGYATAGEALKDKILNLLEKDREFRYAVMGLLGFKELLERFSRLEEHQQRLEERQQRLEERQQRLEEHFARLEERQQRLEERFAELEKHFARLEERQQRLEERQQRLEERVTRVEEEMIELRRVVIAVAHRFGIITESTFRETMKYVIEDVLGTAKVERKIIYDDEGLVYGHPSVVDIDVVIHNNTHILIEVKSRISRSDVAILYRKGILYEKKVGVKPKLIIIGAIIDEDSYETSKVLGVEIKPAVKT